MGSSRSTMLLVLTALSALAWMELSSADDCYMTQDDVYCALPEVGDAASTGSVRMRPGHLVQGIQPMCETFLTRTYRTADGTCNHLLNYGAASRPARRLLPPAYGDPKRRELPRMLDSLGQELPSPTKVSRRVHPSKAEFEQFTVMLMQWGQFIDHDITAFPITSEEDESMKCCGTDGALPSDSIDRECFPIHLDENDNRFRGECMEFARSVAARNRQGKKLVPREQINSVTSFIDGSMVYGSSQELQEELRGKSKGELRATMRVSKNNLLPENPEEVCIHEEGEFCFLAGDSRVNEQPGLTAIHTLFVRIHNIMVNGPEGLEGLSFYGLYKQEDVFQAARKIVAAIIQNIHYGEWLPLILGPAAMSRFDLNTGDKIEYDPFVDPRIANAFATAAFRFGHSLIPDTLLIDNERRPLRDLFQRVSTVFENFSGVLLALIQPSEEGRQDIGAQKRDRFFAEEITGHLFETNETESGSDGLDLVGLNIQRGRDHGLPPYNEYRKLCGLKAFKDFSDFRDDELEQRYRGLYSSVDDIDLFSGLMSEPITDGLVGPTLACLLGLQFRALKFGDRFYFETTRSEEGFTDEQLESIRKITMAHLYCQMDGVKEVQKKVFEAPSEKNPIVDCGTLKQEFNDMLGKNILINTEPLI